MRSTGRAGGLIVALAIGIGPAACGAIPGPSRTPPPSTPSSPRPATPRSVAPTASPTPSPPPVGLAQWRELPTQDALRSARFFSVARIGSQIFGLGCVTLRNEGCTQPAIWVSDDGLAWRSSGPVFLPPESSSGMVTAAVASRIGTLAAGSVRTGNEGDRTEASIWLLGGNGWAQITPQSASDSTITALVATDSRVIAVGSGAFTHFSGFRAWWSADGTTWQAAPSVEHNLGGSPTGLLPVAGAVLAWGTGCGDICPPVPSAWWLTADGTAWQPIEAPGGLAGANVNSIGHTHGGFEAFGTSAASEHLEPAAWAAGETGAAWQAVEPPPRAGAPIRYHVLVGHGSVLAGSGLVWLRGPGETSWRAPLEIPDIDVVGVIQHPQQLNRIIVIGRTFEGLEERLVIWTGLVDWAP